MLTTMRCGKVVDEILILELPVLKYIILHMKFDL